MVFCTSPKSIALGVSIYKKCSRSHLTISIQKWVLWRKLDIFLFTRIIVSGMSYTVMRTQFVAVISRHLRTQSSCVPPLTSPGLLPGLFSCCRKRRSSHKHRCRARKRGSHFAGSCREPEAQRTGGKRAVKWGHWPRSRARPGGGAAELDRTNRSRRRLVLAKLSGGKAPLPAHSERDGHPGFLASTSGAPAAAESG